MATELVEVREPKTHLARRVAERFGNTPDEAAALYLGDLYLSFEFPHVFFHSSPKGRQARIRGTGLAVWELVKLIRELDGDAAGVAAHLAIEPELVDEALEYAKRNPRGIEQAIRNSQSFTLPRMKTLLPSLHVFDAHDDERS